MNKRTAQSAFFTLHGLIVLLLCVAAAGSMVSGTMLAFFRPEASSKIPPRTLTVAERVSYQRAIEDVYWRHRIWPKERPDPKPLLDAVMSQAQLEKKVEDYLRDSQMLEDHWQKPITTEQLQVEMNRMARDTKQPEVLQELFQALGNDPAVIAECLVRPVLAERLIGDLSVHGETQRFDFPRTNGLRTMSAVTMLRHIGYTIPRIADEPSTCLFDNWTATSTTNAPSARYFHTAVWTGSEMIVCGGYPFSLTDNSEMRYGAQLSPPTLDPNGGTPTPTPSATATATATPTFVTGGRYNPATDSWTATSTNNAPIDRSSHTAVWTGNEMIVWGGLDQSFNLTNTGGRYNPATNSWTATSTTSAPSARYFHTAVWTGSEMIVWGGYDGSNYFNTGSRYNPSTDSWTATSTTGAPDRRFNHTAVWTDSEMIVWGGFNGSVGQLFTGGRYDPATDSWTATSTANPPSAREAHTAVWTGSKMIVWGGCFGIPCTNILDTGGGYNPSTNTWTATNITNAPSPRYSHTAVWTGNEMIVWGGSESSNFTNTGGRYNPATDSWTATNTTNAPSARYFHTAVWTASEMIVWGGSNGTNYLNTGGRYCAQPSATPTPTPTATVTPTSTATPTATPTLTPRPSPTPRFVPTPRVRPTPPPRP